MLLLFTKFIAVMIASGIQDDLSGKHQETSGSGIILPGQTAYQNQLIHSPLSQTFIRIHVIEK